MNILVLNTGSSSVKYQVFDSDTWVRVAGGSVDDLSASSAADSFGVALTEIVAEVTAEFAIEAVGHRVVHGGADFVEACLIDADVEQRIADLSALAPLHNPSNLVGIRAAKAALPDVPHVAVFDTAFHRTMPKAASTMAIPQDIAVKHGIQKYGFHGSSHSYVSQLAHAMLAGVADDQRIITVHLGNGSSVAAIQGGKCIDTSMGFTPLQGLVMGTRTGDLDPAILLYLLDNAHMSTSDVADMVNKRSGLLALAGTSDFREVQALKEAGDAGATLALDVWAWRIRHYIGAYAALLGGVDALVFTGGIGENSANGRAMALQGLEFMGLNLDSSANEKPSDQARIISTEGSLAAIMVIPTNEELEIATETHLLVTSAR